MLTLLSQQPRGKIVGVVALGLALIFGATLIWIIENDLDKQPWDSEAFAAVGYVLFGLIITGSLLIVFLLPRNGRTRIVTLAIGPISASLGMWGLLITPFLQFANAKWDSAPKREIDGTVSDKEAVKNRGKWFNTWISYRLDLNAPTENPVDRRLSVKYSLWSAIDKGDHVRITIGSGLFHWPYVAAIVKPMPIQMRSSPLISNAFLINPNNGVSDNNDWLVKTPNSTVDVDAQKGVARRSP